MTSPSLARRAIALALLLLGCDDAPITDAGTDAGVARAEWIVDFASPHDTRETFFDAPFPSDLRLVDGRPDLTGYPNPGVRIVSDLLPVAQDRPGWPVIPVGYFRFGAPVAERVLSEPIAAEPSSPVLLVDVDPTSPDRGALVPTIAIALAEDGFTRTNLVGVAAYPGIVLHPHRTYAFVILRAFGDASGAPLEVAAPMADLAADRAPPGGEAALALYAPMFETLDTLGVPRADVAAATVFTTGDVVEALHDLSDRVLAREDVTIEGLALDGDGDHARYCELVGTVSMPQFQVGTPPFDSEGLFEIGADGLPIEQRREVSPIVFAIPKGEMPESGFPLMVYFHGSGGIASQVVDRSPEPPGGAGLGPAHMIAAHGFASVGAALPLSPDRLPGASSIEYLNFGNLAAFRDTFRQGVIEQRLLIEALRGLRIDPATLGACTGATLPAGETAFRFDTDAFVGLGQSMGGMYTNLIGATEPSLRALVPTGAGGFWSYFILETTLIENTRGLLSGLLRTQPEALNHLHPAMHLLELAWEPAEPMVFVPRLSRRPLEGFSSRPVYEPVGRGDSFFPIQLYDAMALAYGHRQAGEVVWPSMQASLAVTGLDGVVDYPVANELTSESGETYTGVVVQSAGDGFSDPHNIFVQVEDIRYQWGCFLETAISNGVATVPAPAAEGTPCPVAE
ncbi:MAG: hypothetical protein AB7S26_23585 [Sandaracinaceae bacterium]